MMPLLDFPHFFHIYCVLRFHTKPAVERLTVIWHVEVPQIITSRWLSGSSFRNSSSVGWHIRQPGIHISNSTSAAFYHQTFTHSATL